MKAEIAIIGGGIQGLMLAFCLAERGQGGIVVLDAGYWQGGASGRNGTLVRPGFASREWTGLFNHSHRQWLGLSRRLGHNVMFSCRGYVVIAESERTAAACEQMLRTGREHGVDVRALPADEFRRRVPSLNHARVKSAIVFDAGGTAPHHATMKGLRAACQERGVVLRYQTQVTGVEREGDRIATLLLGEERLATNLTVIAAGTHSPNIARMAGLELEGRPWRLEACAIEPTRAAIGPALAMLDRTVYMHQTARGEIVGGCEVENAWTAGATLVCDLPVITHYARHLVEMIPSLAGQRILRQWAGHIHATADFAPLLGSHPDCRDLWVTAGWSYGIAGAAGAGDLLAKAIVTGEIDSRMAPFAVDRKRHGKLIEEGGLVIME